MIPGEMLAPDGVLRFGGYAFRPRGLWHGPHVSDLGFFQIMRSPEANPIVPHSMRRRLAMAFDPTLLPDAPSELRAEWLTPQPFRSGHATPEEAPRAPPDFAQRLALAKNSVIAAARMLT